MASPCKLTAGLPGNLEVPAATEASSGANSSAATATAKRFGLNLVTNVGKLGLNLAIGLFYVPFLVRRLGPAAYGLIPLTSMMTSYMGLVTFSLQESVARYLAISLGRKDARDANMIFNVAVWGNLAIVVLLGMLASVAVINVDHLVRVPPGYEVAARWLFAGTVAAFLLNQIRSPFLVPSFCLNRIDLQNIVTVAETLTRVGLVVALFLAFNPRIQFVGVAILAGTVVSTIGAIWLWKALSPGLHIRFHDFDWTMLKKLYATGGWVSVSQIGTMLYLYIDVLVANRLFGAELSGKYAAVLQLPTLLRALGIAVGEIFVPTMYQKFAQGNQDELAVYLNRAIKFLGLIMALAIGLICGFSKPLLELWLGPTFGSMAPLLFLMAIHLCINLSMFPLYAVPLAANRLKVPGIVTLAVGVLNLALALLFAAVFGWGLYGIAMAGAISLTVRHLLFTPVYAAIVLKRPYKTFYPRVIPIVLATLSTIGMCRLILSRWAVSNWFDLGIAAVIVSVLFAGVTYLFLSGEERTALKVTIVHWSRAVRGA